MENSTADQKRKIIFPSGITLEIHAGDITRMDTDVIINTWSTAVVWQQQS
jgi:hypothetical protein